MIRADAADEEPMMLWTLLKALTGGSDSGGPVTGTAGKDIGQMIIDLEMMRKEIRDMRVGISHQEHRIERLESGLRGIDEAVHRLERQNRLLMKGYSDKSGPDDGIDIGCVREENGMEIISVGDYEMRRLSDKPERDGL